MTTQFKLGDWNALCDVCGFKFKASKLRKRWDGLMVCNVDYETRHPQDLIRVPKDTQAVPWTRPEPADTFIEINYQSYLYLPGVTGNYASTPDSAANSVTGDTDIRVKVACDDWTPNSNNYLWTKSVGAPQLSYLFYVSTTGLLSFYWSEDGSTPKGNKQSTVATGLVNGALKWVRVTVDIDNGAVGHTITFYLSDDGDDWTVLGVPVVTAGVTSIFDSTTTIEIGSQAGGVSPMAAKVYYAELRNGIDGMVVASFNIPDEAVGETSFTSSTGEVWTINQSGSNPALLKYITNEDPIPSGTFTNEL